jgi:DNA-binding NarL/FixJ family response regulator
MEELAAENKDFPGVVAAALHCTGLLETGAEALLQAASLARHPWARASAAEDASIALARDGCHEAARRQQQAALADYERVGAKSDIRRIRARGVTHAPSSQRHGITTTEGWAGLTPGERNVMQFVSQGLSNRKIAERMFLSVYTVDFHLRQVYRKLNVTSRVEAARVAFEHHVDR